MISQKRGSFQGSLCLLFGEIYYLEPKGGVEPARQRNATADGVAGLLSHFSDVFLEFPARDVGL